VLLVAIRCCSASSWKLQKFEVKPSSIPDYLALVGEYNRRLSGAAGMGCGVCFSRPITFLEDWKPSQLMHRMAGEHLQPEKPLRSFQQ
jgi:hypothetical protein